jgi:DNA-binding LytR/AlgR family response regulator
MKENITSKLPFAPSLNVSERLQSPFPYYLNDDRKNLLIILAISSFVVFFMLVYRPVRNFEEELTFGKTCIFGGVTFIVLTISIVILPKLFPAAFDPTNWTIRKYLLQTLGQCFIIGVVSVFIDKLYICPQKSVGEITVHAFTQVALIGIIPVTIMTMLLKNIMLQQNLRVAIQANHQIEKIRSLKHETAKPGNNEIILFSDTSETLKLNLPDLLFIQADDNYATVYWIEKNQIQKKLLRANLKNLETQLDNAFTIRCHRSFIVNIHAISSVTGNTNGYKLRIKDSDHFIPVARPKGKEVMEKIGQLKNMMELY